MQRMLSPTRDRSRAWTSKRPGKARSTPGKPERPMTVVPLKRMSFAKPRVETHRRRNKRKSHASAPFRPHTAVRGGQEEGALRSRSPNSGGLCRLGSPHRAAPVDRTRRHPPAQRLRRGENPAPLVPTPLCGEAAKKGLGGQEAQETEAGK